MGGFIGMFNGIKRSYILLAIILMEIIEEFGTDVGLRMYQNSIEKQANLIYKELKKDIQPNLDSLDKGIFVYRRFMEEAGAEIIIHKNEENSVTFLVRQCPFYEAFINIGIDCGYFLGSLCTYLIIPAVQAVLECFDACLKLEAMLIRESAEEFCLEKIILTK